MVDDNSRDGTGELADTLAARRRRSCDVLHRPGKAGLGRAYVAGFAARAGRRAPDYVIEMDADLSHDPADLPRLLEAADAGADLVLGSRYVAGRRDRELGPPAPRALARRLRLRPPRAGRRRARPDRRLQVLPRRARCARSTTRSAGAQGYAFQVELTWRALQLGLRVVEVPIRFRERRLGRVEDVGADRAARRPGAFRRCASGRGGGGRRYGIPSRRLPIQ